MSGKKAFIWSTTAAPVVLGVASGALAGSERWPRGGFVKPCSLTSQPVYQPESFGNPTIAR